MLMFVTSMLFTSICGTVVLRAPDCIHFSTHEDTEGQLEARQQKREEGARRTDGGFRIRTWMPHVIGLVGFP